MADSREKESKGEELLETIAALTGLPDEAVREELNKIVAEAGHNDEELTMDQLRSAMLGYLETLSAEMGEEAPEAIH